WPISLLAPMAWRGEISEAAYLRTSLWFLPGFITIVPAAYGASSMGDFPTTAAVVITGAVHLLAVLVMIKRDGRPRWGSIVVGGSLTGIGGVIADLPVPGWNTLALLVYGVVGASALGLTLDRVKASGR